MWTENGYEDKVNPHGYPDKISHHGYEDKEHRYLEDKTVTLGNHEQGQTAIFDLDLKEIKKEAETIIQKENKLKNATKSHSTPLTLKWLEENYETAEGVCIPRSTLYLHYLHFCEKNDSQPVNAASFGKIIRQQFPHLTTRRLGTRGQSKYHYYGIGITDESPYFELKFSKHGVQSNMENRKDSMKQVVAYSPRSKLGTLLPEFPSVKDIKLPADVEESKVTTFLMMYRTHCQRILDTVIRANFEEVQSFLLHFWQGMPQHIVPVLGQSVIVNLVGVCDSILYKAIAGVLMPTVLQALPESLTQVIRTFSRQLDEWLRVALEDLPQPLVNIKFNLARRFAQMLRRQTSLNHLCQAARTVIQSGEIVCQMIEDWGNIDLSSICKQTLYTMDSYRVKDHEIIIGLYKEFEQLLEEQSSLEAYTYWLDSLVDRCVVQPSRQKAGTLRRLARQFLLLWSCFGTRVIRDMTLHSAPSFGSFHLLHLMFDDYVLYLIESLHTQERANELLRIIKGEATARESESGDELTLSAPSLLSSPGTVTHPSPQYHTLQCGSGDRQSVIAENRDPYSITAYSSPPASRTSPTNSCDITTLEITPHNNYTNTTPVHNTNLYNTNVDYTLQTPNPYSYNSCLQNTQKYNYTNRPNQKSTGSDWPDSSYHRYGYLLSSSQSPSNYSNYDNTHTDYNDVYGYSGTTMSGSRVNTHFQQGVIYTPYGHTATSNTPGYYGNMDNNNMDRKRKLEDETNMAAKRLVGSSSYPVQQYTTTGS